MKRMLYLTWAVVICMGLSVACGSDDDDDDDGADNLDALVRDTADELDSSYKNFSDKACECIVEMGGSQADCPAPDDSVTADFDAEGLTDCDEQVYAKYPAETKRALGCVASTVSDVFNGFAAMSCNDLLSAFAGDEEPIGDMDTMLEECYPGWGQVKNEIDTYVENNGLAECATLFDLDDD